MIRVIDLNALGVISAHKGDLRRGLEFLQFALEALDEFSFEMKVTSGDDLNQVVFYGLGIEDIALSNPCPYLRMDFVGHPPAVPSLELYSITMALVAYNVGVVFLKLYENQRGESQLQHAEMFLQRSIHNLQSLSPKATARSSKLLAVVRQYHIRILTYRLITKLL